MPNVPVPDTVPAESLYDKWWYCDRKIYACAHSQSLAYITGTQMKLYHDLRVGYVEGLLELKKDQQSEVCAVCIANQKVRDKMRKIENKGALNVAFLQATARGAYL